MIVALIPAHNEQAGIAAAVEALKAQTTPPDHIIVIADRCTDQTPAIAQGVGAVVWPTLANRHKKAGALNQALGEILAKPFLADDDIILVQDADSILDPEFVDNAVRRLKGGYDAVGGVFRGSAGADLVGHYQRLEYVRYAGDVKSLDGRSLVLTGTAVAFTAGVLREVIEGRRSGAIPFGSGDVYDTTVLTEDNELSLALKHLGKKIISAPECTLVTEVMPTWGKLWKQRERWKRGALENCFQYGITRITWRAYWGRQILTLLGCIISVAYLSTLVLAVVNGFRLSLPWLALTAVFCIEHAVTVRRLGWRQQLASATLYEMPYEFFLQAVSLSAFAKAAARRRANW